MKNNIDLPQTIVDKDGMNLYSLPQIGEVVNAKYKVVREIARGGMGVIYEAFDIISHNKVAIKMLQFQDATSIAMKRFEREWQACSQLSHPNIIKMYDCGAYKNSPYMVMDYIEGISITNYIKKHDPAYGTSNRRNYNLCVKLIIQIAHALEYVHQHKIYHRDIKPSNILVTEDGTAILIDFGIVKFQEEQAKSLTKTTEIIGTCHYMSPEQMEGKFKKLDNRSDVYSLGIVLYELVTERHAFNGSLMEILHQIATVYPPLPTTIKNDVSKSLEEIIMTSIDKDKKYRYASAEAFAEALEEYLENRHKINPVHAKRASRIRQRSTQKDKSFANIMILAVVVALCLYFFISLTQPVSKPIVSNNTTITENNTVSTPNQETEKEIVSTPNQEIKKETESIAEQDSKEESSKKSKDIEEKLKLAKQYYDNKEYMKALEIFQQLAEQGDKEAQYKLGRLYFLGHGVRQDFTKARIWFEKAAEQNHEEAICHLGILYFSGRGVAQNFSKARLLYEKSSELGNPLAQNNLASMYLTGQGVKPDFQKARLLFEKAAEQNLVPSVFTLGSIYQYGRGVERNLEKARYWYERAANLGSKEAKIALDHLNKNLKKIENNDFALVEQKAKQGDDNAQFELGVMYADGIVVPQDYQKVQYWWGKAAEQGNANAQNNLGFLYSSGRGVKINYKRALYWYEKAAEQGHAKALANLAKMYKTGNGVPQNIEKACSLLEQAAEKGDIESQYILGLLYDIGKEIKQDYQKALYWYEKAANQGHIIAQNNLGIMYADGKGTPQDIQKARFWIEQSAKKGFQQAKLNLQKIAGDHSQDIEALDINLVEQKAKQGDINAQCRIGYLYDMGKGVQQDYEKARYWYEKAANQGHAVAQNNLGTLYSEGKGVPQDKQQARYWYEKAAKQGLEQANFNLERISNNSQTSNDNSLSLLEQKAEQGDVNAQNQLGFLYYEGKEIKQNLTKARYWLENAAKQGNAEAQNTLGVMYCKGEGVEKNFEKAISLFEYATKQNLAQAQNNLGIVYRDGVGIKQDINKARYYFEKAAKQNFQPAQNNLAQLNKNKSEVNNAGNNKNDFDAIEEAAYKGDAQAQNRLGLMYLQGQGTKQNLKKAFYWFEKSAEQGLKEGQNNLGSMYYNGQGVAQNFAKAFELYEQAAYQGLSQAQYNLSVMYAEGQGVEKNTAKAEYWLKQSQQKK